MQSEVLNLENDDKALELFSRVLTTHSIVDRFDLNWAKRVAKSRNAPLTDILIELELATPIQIQDALEVHKRLNA